MRNCKFTPAGRYGLLLLSFVLCQLTARAQPGGCITGGTFTINQSLATGGTNYQTFTEAVAALSCGTLNAPVVFNVASANAVYNEQVIIPQIAGASQVNTITFNGNGNTLTYAASVNTERATVKLNGADHVQFNNLKIQATGSLMAYGVQLLNNADSNSFRKCTITINPGGSLTSYAGIVLSSSPTSATLEGVASCDGNVFEDNAVTGGYYGLTMVGNTDVANQNNIVRRNTFSDFYYGGMYISGASNILVDSNSISRPTRTGIGYFFGIYVTNLNTRLTISRNRIFSPAAGNPVTTNGFYGIYFLSADAYRNLENRVYNNLICQVNNSGDAYGIYNYSSDYALFYNNTIHIDGASTNYAVHGFYLDGTTLGVQFMNNNVAVTRSSNTAKYAVFLASSVSAVESDYNNLYVYSNKGANNIGYSGSARSTLSDWQATGQDAHSVSVDPSFTDLSVNNLVPRNAALDNKGYAGLVTDDIAGNVRSSTTPDMGAYEFAIPACSAATVAGTVLASATEVCENAPVAFNIVNSSVGVSQTFQWQASVNETSGYYNVGTARQTPEMAIQATTTLYYRVMVSCGGNTAYAAPVKLLVHPAFPGGNYVIDKGGSGNFTSFNEAKAAIACGISGPVVFTVKANSGPYNEQLILDSIPGASAINTITFKGNGNRIQFASNDNYNRGVIALNGADYVTFDSLVVDAVGGGYGWGIFITNGSDSNTIHGCTILADVSSSSGNYSGIVISASATNSTDANAPGCDGNVIEGNSITGGYYGISLMSSTAAPTIGNRVLNNVIKDFYYIGIFSGNTRDAMLAGNDISRAGRSGVSSFIGVYAYYVSDNLLVNGNKIHNTFDAAATVTGDTYGVLVASNTATAQPAVVTNNLLYNFNGLGIAYGLYVNIANNVNFYHNTVSLDYKSNASATATYGLYIAGSASKLINFKNNIVSITRGGTGNRYGVYVNSTSATYVSDYNNIYVQGASGGSFYGYASSSKADLAQWRRETTQDAHSTSLDPLYTNAADANFVPLQGYIDNTGTPVGITVDFTGAVRSTTTPDVGAYEFSIPGCIDPPVAGASQVSVASGICMGQKVLLSLTGNSTGGHQRYIWQRAAAENVTYTDISDTLYQPTFTHELASTASYFRAVVLCGTGIAYSTPVKVQLNAGLMAGDYTIDATIAASATNFTSFANAVAAMQCGIEGSVRFLVAPGLYNEQVRIPKIPGASAAATVTFMSADNNASSVTLSFAGTSARNYVLLLDTASFISFKNIKLTALGTAYIRGVVITAASSYDSITGCTIQLPAYTGADTTQAGIYGTDLSGTENRLIKNTITNGATGIYLSGRVYAASRFAITANEVSNDYRQGVYAANITHLVVNNNILTKQGVLSPLVYGLLIDNCDSLSRIEQNSIRITNTASRAYGIAVKNAQATQLSMGYVHGNHIVMNSNSSTVTGLFSYNNTYYKVANNTVSVGTTADSSLGIYNEMNTSISYYNNSVHNTSASVKAVAALFNHIYSNTGRLVMKNNIFSATGGQVAAEINASDYFIYSDYNLFYTGKNTVVRNLGAELSLAQWRDSSQWDIHSLVYKPAFGSEETLAPDVTSPEVWAIHGRGVQVPENSVDGNNVTRPVTLEEGVPDLGAYEFTPSSVPVVLKAQPATPQANATQVFTLGTDTVSVITWGATVPASVEARRYSGVAPEGTVSGQQYMYFYTAFTVDGSGYSPYALRQVYIPSWQGLIASAANIRMGKTNAAGAWDVQAGSSVAPALEMITATGMQELHKITGLKDEKVTLPPVVISASDSSNRGTRFWVAYGHNQSFGTQNNQEMLIYVGAADKEAHVTIQVNGTDWKKSYTVAPGTVAVSDLIPKVGIRDARLLDEGLSERGILIESDVPVTAFAHIYGSANSGATMLLPEGTYGYEYYALASKQYYASGSYSWFYVVAAYDSTVVEITPAKNTVGGHKAGETFTVQLNKGQVYQVMGALINASEGYDVTGSRIKAVANANGRCFPVAVFSGSSRTTIGCGNISPTLGGDNLIQQNFPYRAWGRRYLTAPTSASTNAALFNTSIYKVVVKDKATVVKRNGVVLTDLVDNLYYQFASSQPDYIEADKPVMVAQFMPTMFNSSCTYVGDGDPEMIYLSPLEQGIKEVALYRNAREQINVQYLTLIIPEAGVASLVIDGSNTVDYVTDHPGMPGYKVVVKRWDPENAQTFVKSEQPFTAITYGMGVEETYGYNAGTLVKNQLAQGSFSNIHNPLPDIKNTYTCVSTPLRLQLITTVQPVLLEWELKAVAGLTPNDNIVQSNPVPSHTTTVNGITYYEYNTGTDYVFTEAGDYTIPVHITHPDVEGCNSRLTTLIAVKVVGPVTVDFAVSDNCEGKQVKFSGSSNIADTVGVAGWAWNFGLPGAVSAAKDTVYNYADRGAYDVTLQVTDSVGCIADTLKPVTVGAGPDAVVVPDSVGVCTGNDATFTLESPVAGVEYNWYDAAAAGNVAHTGEEWTLVNVTAPVYYWIESNWNGCLSASRTKIMAYVLPSLQVPVVVASGAGKDSIRFSWMAVTGATGYEVSIDNGITWITPSTGATGLSHTVTGLSLGETITLKVRVLGSCTAAESAPVSATTMQEEVFAPNSLAPNSAGPAETRYFRIYGNMIQHIRLLIFNQWGEKVFETRNVTEGWDGSFKGKLQPTGVYIYVADITLTNGKHVTKKGAVNLIR
ncbi:gliding motility-associated C-terminal domain-containing protein [Filimonas lacunae]|uniref:Gliding motility-associated C-terminal domain-containing protein n=1 Tax=Filimonas lacunae TaxID=477680 RepID=A0A173MBL9_9BACT|nr:right-handed parallel beta-helix repeat-containing protein [Filimonas lacunae]BAV04945.1 Muc19 precursor [Filimonas lacunae]SIT33748.1 gliding motility-associated C-terminal domain-containing protein [Filimonas lacunae]